MFGWFEGKLNGNHLEGAWFKTEKPPGESPSPSKSGHSPAKKCSTIGTCLPGAPVQYSIF